MAQSELLTAEEVASLLRVKASTVYDAAARGVLPVLRLWKGKRRTLIRFQREDIETFIRERATAPNSTAPEGRARKG
jgi:excisionase family DNA binding protein